MLIKENEPLAMYTTFKMGGNVKKMYFPESVSELQSLITEKPDLTKYIIGGGSNLLINDCKEFGEVLCVRNFNNDIKHIKDGKYYIGASVRLQKAIKTINNEGYGGIEYLFSVPGLIGGAIYMNAGRGKKHKQCISDYIISVDVLIDGILNTVPREEGTFSYRNSSFQTMKNCIIIGALFEFPSMSKSECDNRIKERLDLCKEKQDMSAPNFGTVFCESNKYIISLVKLLHIGKRNGCHFSDKTKNWMLHGPQGSFKEAISLLENIKKVHRLLGQKCRAEVRVWID